MAGAARKLSIVVPAQPGPDKTPRQRRRNWNRRVAAVWPLVLIGAGLAVAFYWLTKPPPQIGLRAVDAGGQMRITWDRTASAIRQAGSAQLEIRDGNAKTWLELEPEQLRNGNVTYTRRSNNVTVRLKVQRPGAEPLEELVRYIGPPEQLPAPSPEADRQKQLELEAEALRQKLKEQASQPPRPEPVAEVTSADRLSDQPRRFVPAPSPPKTTTAPELTPPPQVAHEAPPSSLPRLEPLPPPPAAEKPAPVRPVAQSPPTALPTAGRLVWTGRLLKNGTVTIDGTTASTGSLTGELPGKPIKYGIYPGDLSSDGIILYTLNTQYATGILESPGPQNGWNKTVYTWNPRFAGDIIVAEAPGPQNGWKRLALRSKNAKISVIFVDWTLLP